MPPQTMRNPSLKFSDYKSIDPWRRGFWADLHSAMRNPSKTGWDCDCDCDTDSEPEVFGSLWLFEAALRVPG